MGLNHGWRGPDIVRDGLVLYLDAGSPNSYQGTGTIWKDISKVNQNNGTLTNGPTFSSANGGSIVFDGVDDRVNCSGVSPTLDITSQITMIAWVNPSAVGSSYQGVFLRQTQGDYELWMFGNKLMYGLKIGGVIYRNAGSTVLSTNNWYMLAWTYNGSTVQTYVNSVADLTVARTGSIDTSNSIVYIGYSGYASEYFTGRISICQLYNKALSPAEINQNFNALRGRFGI
jgi:hypothetical protein